MKNSILLVLFVLLVALFVTAYAGESGAPNEPIHSNSERITGSYNIKKSYPLTKEVNGIDGVFQLLQDNRLTKDDYNKQLGATGCEETGTHKSTLGAVLRIMSKREGIFQIIESYAYEVSVAWLEEVRLSRSDTPTYLFTLDESTGMGSYAGPITYFYKIVDGRLKPVEYLNDETKKKDKIILMRSLKTAWKLVTAKDGKSKDILHIVCRPDGMPKNQDDDIFLVYYDRFHFNGKEWVKYRKVEKGFWEAEGEDLPPPFKFPASP